ncbi:MAG: DUF4177 domain-containing protein [Desulfopila sp.]
MRNGLDGVLKEWKTMRWCYKTVHFALKKEGFLGNSFLDEAEVEEALNDYGQSGWELVSIIETEDGVIAVFKQPLDPVGESVTPAQVMGYTPLMNTAAQEPAEEFGGEDDLITEQDVIVDQDVSVDHRDVDAEDGGDGVDDDEEEDDDDLYTIRIE